MAKILHRSITLALALSLGALTIRSQESEQLYEKKCGTCHPKDGSGRTGAPGKLTVPDLRSKSIREMSDAELADSIANGTRHRDYPHAFLHTGMTSEQITGLVKHIRSLQQQADKSATQNKTPAQKK